MPAAYTVEALSAAVPVAEYMRSCLDVEKFLGFCRECRNYEKRWSCPPFQFDPADIWRKYKTLWIPARVLVPQPGAETSDLLEGMEQEKAKLMAELLELERTHTDSLALSAGTCRLCGECARPSGTPCRNPSQMRYSIEALGGDVARTAEQYLHKPLKWIENGKLPEYLMLVGGLLMSV